jgi:hypothetical protein
MANTTLTPAVGAGALAGAVSGIWPSSGFFFATEYQSLLQNTLSGAPIAHGPPLATQVIQISGISTASQPFSPATRILRLHTDTTCSIFVGSTTPVAASGAQGTGRLPANGTEFYSVEPGDRVAVISST